MAGSAAPPFPKGILIDQGLADKFLAEQLYPEAFERACRDVGQPLELRRHPGYDHGYYFISTFVDDHLRFHRRNLGSLVGRRPHRMAEGPRVRIPLVRFQLDRLREHPLQRVVAKQRRDHPVWVAHRRLGQVLAM